MKLTESRIKQIILEEIQSIYEKKETKNKILQEVESLIQDLDNLTGEKITLLNPVYKKLSSIRDELKKQAK